MQERSAFVCQVCGLAVRGWRGGWKHCANRHAISCTYPPRVVTRRAYEADLEATIAMIRQRRAS